MTWAPPIRPGTIIVALGNAVRVIRVRPHVLDPGFDVEAEPVTDAPTDRPTVTCVVCRRWTEVRHDGRGFPPDIAKRRLARICADAPDSHEADPQYRAGVSLRGVPV